MTAAARLPARRLPANSQLFLLCICFHNKKNYLFFGSDTGGERAAIMYSIIETCRLNHIDPQRYLQYVLERIAEHPINRIEELLPWHLGPQLNQPVQVKQALAA